MISQPDTSPIAEEPLVAEVKGIYAGLVMVEQMHVEVDSNQTAINDTDAAHALCNEQCEALIALQRTLLLEHTTTSC